jgi:choline dehydrogenase-like flavoprotein
MIQDLRSQVDGLKVEADLCIIGAGAAGIAIATQFAETGVQVCLVESGGYDYEEDTQQLYAGRSLGEPVDLETGRLRMLGGTTNHWGGRCAEYSPAEFATRDWVPYSGWPIDLDELKPFYRRARKLCGLAADWAPNEETLRFLEIADDSGPTDQIDTQIWRTAPDAGGGAWSFGLVYRSMLQRATNVRLLLHANCTAFRTNDVLGHVEAIAVQSLTGVSCTITAKAFVLCCGGIENPRLLLAASPTEQRGLGASHDLIGRFFMQHLRVDAARIVPTQRLSPMQDVYGEFRAADGVMYEVGLTLSEATQREYKLLNCSAVIDYIGDPQAGTTALQDVWRRLRQGRWGDDLGIKVWRVVNDLSAIESNAERRLLHGRHPLLPLESAMLTVDVEQVPNPDSRILLGDERDALGMRRTVTNWRFSPVEKRTVRHFMMATAAAFARRGIGRVALRPWLQESDDGWPHPIDETHHLIGTTRMSAEPAQGVVDSSCRVWGVDNLYVAGSSVFPAGGHVNPTLTLIALAVRLADHLRVRLGTSL